MRKRRRVLFAIISTILLVLIAFIGHLGINYFSGNVHAVIPGKIYRSGQLNATQLQHYTARYHLRTLINLRGNWPSNPWYRVEKKFAEQQGLHYVVFRFSSYQLPTKTQLRALAQTLETAPKPLVFHCEGGADRTGMAAAISMILFRPDASLSQIKDQASWHYNAIARTSVGYQVMRNYFAWLKATQRTSSRENFLLWLQNAAPMKSYHGWFL